MSPTSRLELARQERAELLALLGSLSAEQWAAQSLCPEWSVREVAVHVVSYDELSVPGLVAAFLRGGLRIDRVNALALRRYADLDPDQVLDLVARTQEPRGLTAAMGGGIALTDGTIHHQDIRRALGLPRTIPGDRLRPVLEFALTAPTLPAKRNSKGLRLVATDLDWSVGQGPKVAGPGEALLMAVAGRGQALADLSGDGLGELRTRVGAPAR